MVKTIVLIASAIVLAVTALGTALGLLIAGYSLATAIMNLVASLIQTVTN